MKKNWTRRKFLETGLKGSMVVGSGVVIGASRPRRAAPAQKEKPSAAGLDQRQRELLRAAMDEIIPAGDRMPAASEVGGVEYLDQLAGKAPDIEKDLEKSLAALQELTRKETGKDFVSLSRADRAEALKKLEKQEPEAFGPLRDCVYESYYTQPKVWKLIGYEFHPTNQSGPRMRPFDESVVAKVKKMPKLYRAAP